jgi:hypothetical protein
MPWLCQLQKNLHPLSAFIGGVVVVVKANGSGGGNRLLLGALCVCVCVCVLTQPPEDEDHWPLPPIKAGWHLSPSP